MDLSIEEFQRLADDKSQQTMRIADLERQLAQKTIENEQLKSKVKQLEIAHAAERLKNMLLKNYITLSVEKIKSFVSHLKGLDRFAFLKTFLEYVLPAENYQEQLLLVNEVMVIPEEPKQLILLHNADDISKESSIRIGNFKINGGISAPFKQNIYLKNLLADPDKTGVIDTLYIGAVNVGTNVGGITIRRSDNQEDSEYSRGADLAFNLKYGLHLAKHPDDAIYAHDMVYQPQIGYATLSLKGENSLAMLSRMIVINNY